MIKIPNNKKLRMFFLGFLTGLIPTFLFLVVNDLLLSIWSLAVGLITGILTLLAFFVYSKQKMLGMTLFVILIIVYFVYLLLLWEFRKGFFGGTFIG